MPQASQDVLARQWAELAKPGTWWTGEQRIAIAGTARAKSRSQPAPSADSIGESGRKAAELVAVDAGGITKDRVDQLTSGDLEPAAYVELVGIVARTTAIDTAVIGLGSDLPEHPRPEPGDPTRRDAPGAKRRSAWVPMIGAAGATTALSAVPAEDRAQEELHGALYLSYAEMGDIAIVKGLDRAQMELVAARTSYYNDCYY